MGINGLMSYIHTNGQLLDSYQLHGGYLVIDGSNVACQIYITTILETCAFGGDYDKYARAVSNFFDDLLKCNVTPIVVGDGGLELKKLKTRIQKANEQIKKCASYAPSTFIRPLLTIDVFYSTIKQKGIKVYQSLAEGDASAAGLAKILDCPVLSKDSDFAIFNVEFIPLDTLEASVPKKIEDQKYYKPCKIFRHKNLSRSFPGLESNVLPLAAALLGNDYVDITTFKTFFNPSDMQQYRNIEPWSHRKVYATFKWLSNYSLNVAVEAIITKCSSIPKKTLIDIIEQVINNYLVLPHDMLPDLELENKYDEKVKELQSQERFVYKLYGSKDSGSVKDKSEVDEIVGTLPSWFCKEFASADLTKYFMNLMFPRIFIFATQLEKLDRPSIHSLSCQVVRVMHGLLVAHRTGIATDLTVKIREGNRVTDRKFPEALKGTATTLFPALKQLRDTDMGIRKKIIDDTLKLTEMEEIFEDVPPQWKLYFAVMHYWAQKFEEPKVNECHIFAILFSILFNVIDRKIGYERSLENFKKVHNETLNEIEAKKKNSMNEDVSGTLNSLEDALEAVTKEDCLLAAPFLISRYRIDNHILYNFDVGVVHVFTGFQSLCKYIRDLNNLLGQPYPDFSMAEFFNGSLLYNLYKDFETQESLPTYVTLKLQQSPNLLSVVKLAYQKITRVNIFEANLADAQVSPGRRK